MVKKFTQPPAPKAPVLPADLAADLAAYDASEPTAAAATAAPVETADESAGTGADAYLAFLEADLPKPVAHHH